MRISHHPASIETDITCTCGATVHTRSTVPNMRVAVCANCHPFFTGRHKMVDTAGRVYVSSADGVLVYHPDGMLLGAIELPGAVNFTFGGPARNVLYITRDDSVWAAHLLAKGA